MSAFFLDVDVLQHVFNKVMSRGLLLPPLNIPACPNSPVVQHVDDTSVLLQVDARQLICLKALLHTFVHSVGLKIYYHKSNLIPINIEEERCEIFIHTPNCKKGSFLSLTESSHGTYKA